jgi:hypothetical protein
MHGIILLVAFFLLLWVWSELKRAHARKLYKRAQEKAPPPRPFLPPSTEMRTFGVSCRRCGRFIRLGSIELVYDASRQDLVDALVKEDWESRNGFCKDYDCGYSTLYHIDDIEFLNS